MVGRRAERAGDRQAVKDLLRRLFQNDYRIVGVDAKVGAATGGATPLPICRHWPQARCSGRCC